MAKIDITGTRGEINFVNPEGKIVHRQSSMDEVMVGPTLAGAAQGHPVALSFEDVQDMSLFTIDLSPDQAEELAKVLLVVAAHGRANKIQ
jgi:hypothetical protein